MLPLDRASRVWLDVLGDSIQRLAAVADSVELVVAGRALALPPAADRHGDAERARPCARRSDAARPALPRRRGASRPACATTPSTSSPAASPAWLAPALRHALAHDADRYPDESAATAAIAALHGRDPEEIVITNGAAEALWLLPAALTPRLAACVHPGFTESEAALRAHGIPVRRAFRDPEAGFALDAGAGPGRGRARDRRQPRLAVGHARSGARRSKR